MASGATDFFASRNTFINDRKFIWPADIPIAEVSTDGQETVFFGPFIFAAPDGFKIQTLSIGASVSTVATITPGIFRTRFDYSIDGGNNWIQLAIATLGGAGNTTVGNDVNLTGLDIDDVQVRAVFDDDTSYGNNHIMDTFLIFVDYKGV